MEDTDAPIFITWFQCLVTVSICLLLGRLATLFPNFLSFPHTGMLDGEKVQKVLPLTVMFVCMITFNNLCLKYVGVAFYYVSRSLSTVFNVIFTYIILGQKTSGTAITCCAVIISGFMLGVDQEGEAGSLSITGVFFGVLASAAVSLNSIYTKKVLPVMNGSIWLLLYYNNALALLMFLPLMVILGEVPAVMTFVNNDFNDFWLVMVTAGIFGFAIGYVTGLQIQVTSPLTHTISGTAKACAQTVLATSWYGELKPWLWWLSNAVVLIGSTAYTRVKQLELKASHHSSAAALHGKDKV